MLCFLHTTLYGLTPNFDTWSSISSCYNSNDALYILHYTGLSKNLQQQQTSADWQFDKELYVTEKHLGEKDLLPIMEMDYHSEGGEIIPYYQYINEELLKIVKNANILELLDVDIEINNTKKYQTRKHSFTNREVSVVANLIETVIKASSAQVSCF